MKLFQKTQDWSQTELCKRILISCPEELTSKALSFCFQPNKLTEFDTLFCLDINRDSSSNTMKPLSGYESFIFQPSCWEELIQSIQEVSEYSQIKHQEGLFAKTTLVLNNWQTASYLFASSQGLGNINTNQFLTQLKFLSDRANVIILSSLNGSATLNQQQLNQGLILWSHLSMNMVNESKLEIVKSSFLEWRIGDKVRLTSSDKTPHNPNQSNIQTTPVSSTQIPVIGTEEDKKYEVNSVQSLNLNVFSEASNEHTKNNFGIDDEEELLPIKNSEYDKLVAKLSSAESKQQLLEARQEIQAMSETLTGAEKVALSDIYKINLNRVKLIEDTSLEIS